MCMSAQTPNNRISVRKLLFIGVKDCLLICEDLLFLLAVKDAYPRIKNPCCVSL